MHTSFGNEPQIVSAKTLVVPDYMKVRLSTGIDFVDVLLGSQAKPGFIAGEVVLLTGDPGSGKSTLCRQVVSMIDLEALYLAGEESLFQVKLAIEDMRLSENFDLGNVTEVDDLLARVEARKYHLVVIDSIQNLFTKFDMDGRDIQKYSRGSKKQVMACVEKIYGYAKRTMTTFLLICQGTKAGDFGGPQALEHLIDCTIKIAVEDGTETEGGGEDGEETTVEVMVRNAYAEKNRFGATAISQYLTMTPHGLAQTTAPCPPQLTAKGKARAGKIPVKQVARQMFADLMGVTKEDFVMQLMEATEVSYATAGMYYNMLRREREAV
jgi:DNA repair protein RadA/Sms